MAFFNKYGKDNLMTLENHGLIGKPVAMNLVFTNVTVGPSWWQLFIGWLKGIFGGEIQSYSRGAQLWKDGSSAKAKRKGCTRRLGPGN